jgi:radical SAM protein with 4Fe4S-binding SPASM domain
MYQCNIPLNMQFEVTYQCNNNCIFCYNEKQIKHRDELDTCQIKHIIRDIKESGVVQMNFNGGEPLMRSDFLELAGYAKSIGLDVHLNTNATLINDALAYELSQIFPSICTTILSGKKETHDMLSGRNGAFEAAIRGIKALQKNNVYVAANVMLCNENYGDIIDTLNLLHDLRIETVLITRYVPDKHHRDGLFITDKNYFNTLREVYNYNCINSYFDRISLPQPLQVCTVPNDIRNIILEWNIPCNIGLCTASVNAYGQLTPCNLVKEPIIGDLSNNSLQKLWESFDGLNYCKSEHLLKECLNCMDIQFCGGGCKGFNMSLCEV